MIKNLIKLILLSGSISLFSLIFITETFSFFDPPELFINSSNILFVKLLFLLLLAFSCCFLTFGLVFPDILRELVAVVFLDESLSSGEFFTISEELFFDVVVVVVNLPSMYLI